MRIDVHAHYFPVEYLDRLDHHAGTNASQFFRKAELASEGFSSIEKNIRNMALANVAEGRCGPHPRRECAKTARPATY